MVLSSKYVQSRTKPLIIGCAASIAIMLFPTLDAVENSNLTVRMIEDILLFVYSIMVGYSVDAYFKLKGQTDGYISRGFIAIKKVNVITKGLLFAIVFPSILVIYWNYPPNFDLTAVNVFARYASDFSYLACAILAGTAISYIHRKFRVVLLLFAFMSVGMMGSMMVVWQPGFYTVYSPAQNTTMNTFMMLFGGIGVAAISPWLMKVLDIL
jgi:hypothetical protein